jgi:hypothetical protein
MWTEYREWTVAELELVKQNYCSMAISELATLVHRSETAVIQKAKQFGLRKTHTWTFWELELLKKQYASASTDELKSLFRHPIGSIIKKAEQLGLNRDNVIRPNWSDDELAILRKLAMDGMSDQEISEKLGRPVESTQRQRLRLSILLRKSWNETEDEILKQRYEITTAEDLSLILSGRSPNAIAKRAVQLGLRKPEIWSEQMDQLLKQKYATSTIRELLVMFPGKTKRQLKRRAQQFGLKKDPETFARCYNAKVGQVPALPCMMTRWRNAVLRRDGFVCQECGCVKIKFFLQAHHIVPRRDPDCAHYDTNNGICLCKDCHKNIRGREYEMSDRYQIIVALNTRRP